MLCGVLALQGDFEAHGRVLEALGVTVLQVRSAADLAAVDGLVLPGGESTTMLRLMESDDLAARIVDRSRDGMPILATCAGVILAAREVEPSQESLGLLDVTVARNAYGRQLSSTVIEVELDQALGAPVPLTGVFIRAPRITRLGPGVEVLGRRGNDPVLVRHDAILAATFHPELTADRRVHGIFVRSLEGADG